jgi:hypothetical protein
MRVPPRLVEQYSQCPALFEANAAAENAAHATGRLRVLSSRSVLRERPRHIRLGPARIGHRKLLRNTLSFSWNQFRGS